MNSRINVHQWFMQFANLASQRSTCCRMKTGAVIVRDGRIVCMGYNGVGSGRVHCDEYWYAQFEKTGSTSTLPLTSTSTSTLPTLTWEKFKKSDLFLKQHHEWANVHEFHGEQNAILFAGKHGIPLMGTIMYSLYSPCTQCAKLIVQSGIKKVYYSMIYNRDQLGLELLSNHQVDHEWIPISK